MVLIFFSIFFFVIGVKLKKLIVHLKKKVKKFIILIISSIQFSNCYSRNSVLEHHAFLRLNNIPRGGGCAVLHSCPDFATPWAVAMSLLCPWGFPGAGCTGWPLPCPGREFLTRGSRNRHLWRLPLTGRWILDH